MARACRRGAARATLAGMLNLITDVPGLRVGNAHDARLASGVTAILFDQPVTASVAVHGGAPGSVDTALLEPEMTVGQVDAVVLSGGSAFGLEAASGVQAALREAGRGFAVGPARVPIVPGAILFDLLNGGDKDWGRFPPYRDLGFEAARAAAGTFRLGTAGAGFGATTATLKGGLGSASAVTASGLRVGAIAAVNALGQANVGESAHFWAAPYERGDEFGGLGLPPFGPDALRLRVKGRTPATTIALVATDAALTKAQAKRLAVAAHDGLARALRPAHAPLDGDTVFAAATGAVPAIDGVGALTELCALAADTLARAVARGVFEAAALPFPNATTAWRDRFGRR